jgi:hypothetical protein
MLKLCRPRAALAVLAELAESSLTLHAIAHLGRHGPAIVPEQTSRRRTLYQARLDGKTVSGQHDLGLAVA